MRPVSFFVLHLAIYLFLDKAACIRNKDGFKTCVYIKSLLLTSPTTKVHRAKYSLHLQLTVAHTYIKSFDGRTERFIETSEIRKRYIWTYSCLHSAVNLNLNQWLRQTLLIQIFLSRNMIWPEWSFRSISPAKISFLSELNFTETITKVRHFLPWKRTCILEKKTGRREWISCIRKVISALLEQLRNTQRAT